MGRRMPWEEYRTKIVKNLQNFLQANAIPICIFLNCICFSCDILIHLSFYRPIPVAPIRAYEDLLEPSDVEFSPHEIFNIKPKKGNAAVHYVNIFNNIHNERKLKPSQFTSNDEDEIVKCILFCREFTKCTFRPIYIGLAEIRRASEVFIQNELDNINKDEAWAIRRNGLYGIYNISNILTKRAITYNSEGDKKAAEDMYIAIVIFGYHILQDQTQVTTHLESLGCIKWGLSKIIKLYEAEDKNTDKIQELKSLQIKINKEYSRAWDKQTLFLQNSHKYSRSLMFLIKKDPDRMWRLNAALYLASILRKQRSALINLSDVEEEMEKLLTFRDEYFQTIGRIALGRQ